MSPVAGMSWSALAPYLVLGGGGLLVLLVDAAVRTLRKDHLTALNVLVLLATAITVTTVDVPPGTYLSEAFASTMFTRFFNLLLVGIGIVTTVFGSAVYARDGNFRAEFYPLVLFSIVGMMMLVSASDLLTLFLGLETMSLSVYVLAAGRPGNDGAGSEGALKYLLLGSFASAFLLMGMALLYGYAGGTAYSAIETARMEGTRPELLFTVGLGLMLVGFGFKVAMVPFHMWTPDVYDGAPAHVTGFMATAVKAAAFAALVRFVMMVLPGLADYWFGLLSVLAVVTMTFGNLLALVQNSVKRMLAYSSIAHAGYLLLGVLAILGPARGMGTQLSIADSATLEAAGSGILFYLLGYSLMNLAAFGVISQLGRGGGDEADQIDHYRGLAARQPGAATVMTIAMLSLAGIPGTVGFLGKFYIFDAVIQADLLPLAIWGVVNSLLSVYYYIRLIVVMFFSESEENPYDGRNWETTVLAGCMAALVIVLGVYPVVAHRAAAVAFG
ncbi:NADH-quinone oxidoreductase subunit NuoN, partial [bacterium]|nr:NADH-quinone oxidoreductase subunit NuoN [bacterium]